jgi:Subtilase family
MNRVYDLTTKLLHLSCCFVALNVPDDEAPGLEYVEEIRHFLNGVARGLYVYDKISAAEDQLYRRFTEARTRQHFEYWLTACIKNRRGYQYLNTLPVDFVFRRNRLSRELAKKTFVKSHIFTRGEMTHTYDYLLNSLRQTIMLDVELPEQHAAWRNVAISLGPVPWYQYSPNEPMNLATLAVVQRGTTVIIAAGNEGRILKGNSLNPWSIPPWVIGVGATDRHGTKLLEFSSRGIPDDEDLAPTVVAPGETESEFSGLDHGDIVALEHIKQAPPGVSDTSVVGRHVLLYFKDQNGRIDVTLMEGDKPKATLPLDYLIDQLKAAGRYNPHAVVGTSVAVEYVKAICSDIAQRVGVRVPNWPKADRPKLIKTVLEDMAQPVGNHARWEVGSGVVTLQIAREYLSSLSDAKLATLCEKAKLRGFPHGHCVPDHEAQKSPSQVAS